MIDGEIKSLYPENHQMAQSRKRADKTGDHQYNHEG